MSKFVLLGLLLVAITANAGYPYKVGPSPKAEMTAERYEMPPPPPPSYETQTYMGSGQYNVPPYGSTYTRPQIVYCNPKVDLTHLPGNCRKFRRCPNGVLFVLTCPDNLVFDDRLKVCNNRKNVLAPCGTASPHTPYGSTYGVPYNVPTYPTGPYVPPMPEVHPGPYVPPMPEAQPGPYNAY